MTLIYPHGQQIKRRYDQNKCNQTDLIQTGKCISLSSHVETKNKKNPNQKCKNKHEFKLEIKLIMSHKLKLTRINDQLAQTNKKMARI